MFVGFLHWLTFVPHALAQTTGIQIQNPLGTSCNAWAGCVQSILGGLAILAAPIVGIMVLVGGYQIMASAGNEEKLKKGKNTILYAVIGYAVILLAMGAASIIQNVVGSTGGSSGSPNAPANCPGSPGCSECYQPNPPAYCTGTPNNPACPGSPGCPECGNPNPPSYCSPH